MRTIARHDVDVPNAEETVELLGARAHEVREDLEEIPLGPGFAMSRSMAEFGNRCASDPRVARSDTWYALVRAMQSSTALFQAASSTGGDVEFRFGDETIRRQATGPTTDSNAVNWLTALYLAMICRDRPRLDLLAGISLNLLRESSYEYDEFLYSWVHALQIHWRGEENLIDTVLEAMSGTDPEGLHRFQAAPVLQQYYPPMELFYRFTQRENAGFNDSLANALDLHKRYWTAEEERVRDPEGFVALGPLAIACLAHDAGVTIEVESDYLPIHLLEGTRVGEMST
ncbi:immunity 49 family protein [Amycolatopsis sp. 195334CR]|uniref:immunity 49 family protein n=1 Tax=Amycolatopsis sp. 195334CR TaxID=2814588 RepID=UPI001A90B535|nr:immunity 49 family protein [Amycolatopsis sp. 195334CR]MBN6041231.1 immunity 49 family protein [Amycolatopsis sp. 195334CR]